MLAARLHAQRLSFEETRRAAPHCAVLWGTEICSRVPPAQRLALRCRYTSSLKQRGRWVGQQPVGPPKQRDVALKQDLVSDLIYLVAAAETWHHMPTSRSSDP